MATLLVEQDMLLFFTLGDPLTFIISISKIRYESGMISEVFTKGGVS